MNQYHSKITVNGKQFDKDHRNWMDAFMHATDTICVLRTQPSFAAPETELDIVISYTGTDSTVATYNKQDGWDFR